MKASLPVLVALSVLLLPCQGQETRYDWDSVASPEIVSLAPLPGYPGIVRVVFRMEIGTKGADRAEATMMDSSGIILERKLLGRSSKELKTADFSPSRSGSYMFAITASRTGAVSVKSSARRSFDFVFPLAAPVLQARNRGKGSMLLSWEPIREAERYFVSWKEEGAAAPSSLLDLGADPAVSGRLETTISGLVPGRRYVFSVMAARGSERSVSTELLKRASEEEEREWHFTWFGQSTKADLNTMEMLDPDGFVFMLSSCTWNPADGQILQKGGKYTAFHDGISFYYTVIDAAKENFELSATFTVDYINSTADGQEGFGLLALDSLGAHGVSSVNHYTNSAGIIATKFEATIDGAKKTSKDTLGARFVSGLTKDIIASGEAEIAQKGTSFSSAYSYDRSDLVRTGDRFRLTLKKTNTGYHAICERPYATAETPTEFILYGPEKLLRIDSDHVYVGFSVARGCNVTVSDVSMKISNPATDPPAQEEPPELVPLLARVDSPSSSSSEDYRLVFAANTDGRLTVRDKDRKILIDCAPVRAREDFTAPMKLSWGINDLFLFFEPDPGYRPGKNMALARYDRESRTYVQSSEPVSLTHTVIWRSFDGESIHVSRNGSVFGDGTQESPLDLDSALLFAKPGQPVILEGGIYHPARMVEMERGNDGLPGKPKILKSAPGERAILDFGYSASGGMVLSGNWWIVESIDIRSTPDNVKGLQVAGSFNIIRDVRTYDCGDTGLQISGSSLERPEKWPRGNLVTGCVSHDNADPAANNADGFAAKLTVGEGNTFRGCIAFHNIDDGWDLFSKVDTGPIGPVLIEGCLSWGNGSLSDGSGNGDGNGFKLGGDGIAVAHTIRNSIAWGNGTSGISSNSNPAVIVERCTSYGNGGANINLYGKGDGSRMFRVSGIISMAGGTGDQYREMPELTSKDNYFWNGAQSVNAAGKVLDPGIFQATRMVASPEPGSDGSIDLQGFLVLTDRAPAEAGARLP